MIVRSLRLPCYAKSWLVLINVILCWKKMVGRAAGLDRIGRGVKDWQVLSNTKLEGGLEIQMTKVSSFLLLVI